MRSLRNRLFLVVFALRATGGASSFAAEAAREDSRSAFRTDFANQERPWYRLQPGVFPPPEAAHRIDGVLVEADFIHRTGQFQTTGSGELADFTMPPFASVKHCNTEADLRDVPLGTACRFFLFQDENGAFTKVGGIEDEYTALASEGITYRLESAKLDEGMLLVTKQKLTGDQRDLGRAELPVDGRTRVWKGDQQVKLSDLAPGDALLVEIAGGAPHEPARCAEIWAGAESQERVTEEQRKKHEIFLKARGLPAWVDQAEGKDVTFTFVGDPANLHALFKDEGIVPAQMVADHRSVELVVANDELRSYNPPVDKERSKVLEARSVPADGFGNSGEQWVVEPNLLLEGFRKGRVVRVFANPAWPIKDMPYGESAYGEVFNADIVETDPNHYPYRTDFANQSLPWRPLTPFEFPPLNSEHRVGGELVASDPVHRSGRFRADRTDESVDFTMLPFGSVLYLGAEADLQDLPIGTHCFFFLHPDQNGAFTKASVITDEFTHLQRNRLSCRLTEAPIENRVLLVAKQIPAMKNELDATVQPPDVGDSRLAVDEQTRVWKGDGETTLGDLAIGDLLLFNFTGRTNHDRGKCTQIWAGSEAQKNATDGQRARHDARTKESGLPAWIDAVDGKRITITFFAGVRRDFQALLGDDPRGKPVYLLPADDELRPTAEEAVKTTFNDHLPEGAAAGAYGSSGVRWVLEAPRVPEGWQKGQIVRVFKEARPRKTPRDGQVSP